MPFTYQHVDEKNILPEKYNGQIVNIGYNGLFSVLSEQLEFFYGNQINHCLVYAGRRAE
jgi:hypothetical protein